MKPFLLHEEGKRLFKDSNRVSVAPGMMHVGYPSLVERKSRGTCKVIRNWRWSRNSSLYKHRGKHLSDNV